MKNFTPLPRFKKFLVFFFLLVIPLIVFNCKDKFQPDEILRETTFVNSSNSLSNAKINYSDDEMVLGKKLEIPYKISNVEKSQSSLKTSSKEYKPIKIVENYYYVRLLPKNEEEHNLINSDSTINTFNHPLDYEVVKQGNKYKDPSLKESKYSYIYCVIPVDKKFNGVKTDILERLYIPFGSGANDEFSKKLAKQEDSNLKELEEEILVSTGFITKNKKAKTNAWYPRGRIRVSSGGPFSSNASVFIPVEGCKVRSTKGLVVTHTTLTENDGTFFINESYWNISNVNYDIKWERADFDIRSGTYGQAYFNGPHQSGDWNCDITSNGTYLNYLYAWAHKAANRYYYHNNEYGILPPPGVNQVSALWGFGIVRLLLPHRMHIGVSDSGNRSHYYDFNDNWLAAEIAVKMGTNAATVDIFATTIHELAHASHWSLGYNTADYSLNANHNRRLAESWAQAVGWFVTARYFGLEPQNAGANIITGESRQGFSLAQIQVSDFYYTPAFIDLIDNFNQGDPNDQANNYTLSELEATLAQCPKNWYAYRDKLAERTNNPSETQAIWIFNNYK